jgi:hypothetical protein
MKVDSITPIKAFFFHKGYQEDTRFIEDLHFSKPWDEITTEIKVLKKTSDSFSSEVFYEPNLELDSEFIEDAIGFEIGEVMSNTSGINGMSGIQNECENMGMNYLLEGIEEKFEELALKELQRRKDDYKIRLKNIVNHGMLSPCGERPEELFEKDDLVCISFFVAWWYSGSYDSWTSEYESEFGPIGVVDMNRIGYIDYE